MRLPMLNFEIICSLFFNSFPKQSILTKHAVINARSDADRAENMLD